LDAEKAPRQPVSMAAPATAENVLKALAA
jgi:hypothetical protein